MVVAYASATAVAQGEGLTVHVSATARARAFNVATGARVWDGTIAAPEGTIIPDWPSGLYRVEFDGGGSKGSGEVYFAVRSKEPGSTSDVLVAIPFLTWQAYNNARVPGEGLYLSEQPDRAVRVSFDRPGGGPAGYWEEPFLRWLAEQGRNVEYCSNIDLHGGDELISRY